MSQSRRASPAQAMELLKSLHGGEEGVMAAVSCGLRIVPELRNLLFAPSPGGIFEARRRAVAALEGLRAFGPLREFLIRSHEFADPVEQTAEDAVVNAAARAVGRLHEAGDVPLLFGLLRRKPLAGVIDALAGFACIEALPYFIAALGDDFAREAAEAAIVKLGRAARAALIGTLSERDLSGEREVDSSLARRRSALGLLIAIPLAPDDDWPALPEWLGDEDAGIRLRAARLALAAGDDACRLKAVDRLIGLVASPDISIAQEAEEQLGIHHALAAPIIEQAIATERAKQRPSVPWWLQDRTLSRLLRIQARHSKQFESAQ